MTDLFVWNLPVYGEPVDGLLREVAALGGGRALDSRPWSARLWQLWPQWNRIEHRDEALRALERDLTTFRDELRRAAIDRGWEVPRSPDRPPGS